MRLFLLAMLTLCIGVTESQAQPFRRNRGYQETVPYTPPIEVVQQAQSTAPAASQNPAALPSPAGSATGTVTQAAGPCEGCPPVPEGCKNCYPLHVRKYGSCGCENLRPSHVDNPFDAGDNPGPIPTARPTGPLSMYQAYVCFSTTLDVPACTSTTALVPKCTTRVITYKCCEKAALAGGAAAAYCEVTVCVYDKPYIADIKTCTLCTMKDVKVQARIWRCDPDKVDIVAFNVPIMPKNWILAYGISRTEATNRFGVTFGSITPLGEKDNPPQGCP